MMKCPHCGARQFGLGQFCKICGIRLPSNRFRDILRSILSRLKALWKKTPLKAKLIASGVLLLLALTLLLIPTLTPDRYVKAENTLRLIYNEETGETVAAFGTKALSTTLPGKVYHYESSLSGSEAAVLMTDGTLFYLTEKSVISAGDGISDFTLASNGGTLVMRTEKGGLYLFDGKKRREITEKAGTLFVLSPDGSSVAYTAMDSDAVNPTLYTYDGRRSVRQNYAGIPLAITDNCSLLYYYRISDEGNFLFVNDKQLSPDAGVSYVSLNRDATEMIFVAAGEDSLSLYLSKDGSASLPLMSVSSHADVPMILHEDSTYVTRTVEGSQVLVMGARTFEENFARSGDALCYFGKSFTVEKVSLVARSYGLSVSDRYVYFVKGGTSTLYRCPVDDRQNAEKLAEEITSFAVTKGGKHFYYTDGEDTLFYVKNDPEKAKEIRKEVLAVCVTGNRAVFVNSDGFLHSVKGGASPKKIFDDIDRLSQSGDTVYYEYFRDGVRHILASRNGKSFSLIYEGK